MLTISGGVNDAMGWVQMKTNRNSHAQKFRVAGGEPI